MTERSKQLSHLRERMPRLEASHGDFVEGRSRACMVELVQQFECSFHFL